MAAEPLSTSYPWRLRQLPVCASTELELERWLRSLGPQPDLSHSGLAVVARRQRFGRGQRGRRWISPPGGLWLSAGFTWPITDLASACAASQAPLTLSAAVGLALQLEQRGLTPQIKWPNDLLLNGRKLAGILPRLRLAGARVRWAQVGLGLNGINRVPAGAIGLGEAWQAAKAKHRCSRQVFDPRATPQALLPLALASLDWARRHAGQGELVLQLAQERLYRPAAGWPFKNQLWQVQGLGAGGTLQLRRDGQQLELQGLDLSPAGLV